MHKRFFEKVRKTDWCWLWTASTRGSGYGSFKLNGKVVDAHRVSWIIHNGEIPSGSLVCHKCDNRLCVNPKHLFLGSYKDNFHDAVKKDRISFKQIRQIRKPYTGKFNQRQVVLIKKLTKKFSNRSIAKTFKVNEKTIRNIKNGATYKNW